MTTMISASQSSCRAGVCERPTPLGWAGYCLMWLAPLLSGCGGPATEPTRAALDPLPRPDGQPYKIVTTCGMVTDIVRHVVGDEGTVTGLMGEGVDPHVYTPTRNDMTELLGADIVFYCGLTLEGRMSEQLRTLGESGKPVFALAEILEESYLRSPPEFEGHYDPHVWMDVSAWSRCVQSVADTMSKLDPEHAETYAGNAEAYRKQLAELDDYVRDAIASIPASQRVLVTAHDAFGYFGQAYDIEVRGVQGISTESEAGINDINRLVDFIVDRKVQAIFVESSVTAENIRAIIEGAADRGWEVAIGGELYSDAMGPPRTYEGTYIGMLDHNATTIARALGGQAPPDGLHGKLRSASAGK